MKNIYCAVYKKHYRLAQCVIYTVSSISNRIATDLSYFQYSRKTGLNMKNVSVDMRCDTSTKCVTDDRLVRFEC